MVSSRAPRVERGLGYPASPFLLTLLHWGRTPSWLAGARAEKTRDGADQARVTAGVITGLGLLA